MSLAPEIREELENLRQQLAQMLADIDARLEGAYDETGETVDERSAEGHTRKA